tara:strand:- start:419 stop:880 length:462 start_codon:yes stop_codon:yes gene_type:complete
MVWSNLEWLTTLNREELFQLIQENAFYCMVVGIVLYCVWYSNACVSARSKLNFKVSQNPIRVATLSAKEREIRVKQAVKFQQELDTAREEHKKHGGGKHGSPASPSPLSSTYKYQKSRASFSSNSYNPLTGSSGGGSSSYKPSNRMRKTKRGG